MGRERPTRPEPDPIAQSLQGGASRIIGVIVPEIVHYFFSTVISGIEDLAYDSGYNVIICQSNESYEREVRVVDALLGSRVDGILVSVSKTTLKCSHFGTIIKAGIPLVFFDRICRKYDTDRVIVDDETGAYEAVKYLIMTGCKNIVHLACPQNLEIGRNRKAGYIRALVEHNMQVLDENIIKCDTSEEAWQIVPGLLARKNRPDGIFAVNDLTAAEAMRIIKHHGYRIPDDISLVGFTSGMIPDLTDPPLTLVEQHGYDGGKEAVRLLIKNLESKRKIPVQTLILKTKLVIKGSTKRQ
jgi:LacI family transcriptional regulator